MDFQFTAQQEAFRQEIRDFLRKELGPDWRGGKTQEMFSREFSRKLGKKGWIGIGWPKEYGGLGRPHMDQLVFSEEMLYGRAPAAAHILAQNMVGPTLINVGSEEHKKKFLPMILSDIYSSEPRRQLGKNVHVVDSKACASQQLGAIQCDKGDWRGLSV